MQNYIRLYLDYFGYGEQDIIFCENCPASGRVDGSGFDIHHINGRGKGKDVIENLMCLCRKDHDMANSNKLPKDKLQTIHNNFIRRHEGTSKNNS